MVRGMDGAWIRNIFSIALIPDAVFYLRVGVDELIPRVVFSRGFDYWESGMDISNGHDMYESFRSYQTALLAEFDRLSVEYSFQTIDASAEPMFVFAQLKSRILKILEQDSRKAYISKLLEHPVETSVQRSEPGITAPRMAVLKDVAYAFEHMVQTPHKLTNGNGHANLQQK